MRFERQHVCNGTMVQIQFQEIHQPLRQLPLLHFGCLQSDDVWCRQWTHRGRTTVCLINNRRTDNSGTTTVSHSQRISKITDSNWPGRLVFYILYRCRRSSYFSAREGSMALSCRLRYSHNSVADIKNNAIRHWTTCRA